MKARLEDKNTAISMRKSGFSYKEIQSEIKVSKGLLSGWFKHIDLSTSEVEFLKSRMMENKNKGRINSSISNRYRRISREAVVFEESKKTFNLLKSQSYFLNGIALYWAEGSKRAGEFQFINSDPEMIVFMYVWIQKYLGIDKNNIKKRLFIHKISGYENINFFWANLLAVNPHSFEKTIYKSTQYSTKKNPNYKGCLCLSIPGIYHLRMVKAWQKLLIQYYSDVTKI